MITKYFNKDFLFSLASIIAEDKKPVYNSFDIGSLLWKFGFFSFRIIDFDLQVYFNNKLASISLWGKLSPLVKTKVS